VALTALVLVAAHAAAPVAGQAAPAFSPQALFDAWPERRAVATSAPCLRHAELQQRLSALALRHPQRVALESLGRSVEGREIQLLTLGRGKRRVLLWSQMHGNEPSATPALVDLVETVAGVDAPEHKLILDRLTLLIVPMLNPDGTERYARRNAQAIDVNRDALSLATPEGRLLKAVRDRFEPELGFNLHDQNRRTSVGETGVPASIALLAVAGDKKGTLTAGRARAKRVASALVRALGPFVPGGIARYDEDWSPRAFGDNLTAWGTPVVLIESGGIPKGRTHAFLTQLNYVGLLTVLHGLARDDLARETASAYEKLARNAEGAWVDAILAGGRILQPPGLEPYPADVAWDVLDDDLVLAGCPGAGPPGPSRIREIGDGRLLAAGERRDAAERVLVPAFAASIRGKGASAWLTAGALDAISRLGVARVRWHVGASDREAAEQAAARLRAPGRARLEVVDAATPELALVIPRLPTAPRPPVSLEAALLALTGGSWRKAGGSVTLPGSLSALVGTAPDAAPPLRPDAEASLVVLQAREAGQLDTASLAIEAVVVDGRSAGGGR
jgi:hypothetical protein